MEYSSIKGYPIAKLTLGTVALGMDYGISNASGKPEELKRLDILSTALNLGIQTFDTARGYGDAETLLGSFLSKNPLSKETTVVTKFRISDENLFDKERAWQEVYDSIKASRQFLGVDCIPICLFHKGRDQSLEQIGAILPSLFSDLKKEGWVDIAGVSVYHPHEVAFFLEHDIFEAMQISINVFDLRLVKSGLLKRLSEKNILVFARSIFLQGLFFMALDDLKGNLVRARPYITQLQALAKQAEMSVAELAFSFIKDMDGISSIVFGAHTVEQVTTNVQFLKGKALDPTIKEAIYAAFRDVPEEIITPGLWQY